MNLKFALSKLIVSKIVGNLISKIYSRHIPYKGYRYFIPESKNWYIASQIFFGIYESAEIRFIRKYLNKKNDVIELGSSIGVASVHIGNLLNNKSRLFCIEANPNLINYLNINLNRNIKKSNYKVLNYALCSTNEEYISFGIEECNLDSRLTDNVSANTVFVKATSLTQLISNLKITKYSLVSDIEGAEINFILNDSVALGNCILLIIELHEVLYNNVLYTIPNLIDLIVMKTSLCLIDHHGNVFVFKREQDEMES